MKYKFYENQMVSRAIDDSYPKIRIAGRGFLRIRSRKKGTFVTKDGRTFRAIHIGMDSPDWKMAVCHEIAHVLLCKTDDSIRYENDGYYFVRREVLVERLAKSFCKPQYWDDEASIEMICGTIWSVKKKGTNQPRRIKDMLLKIIPINKGIRIS